MGSRTTEPRTLSPWRPLAWGIGLLLACRALQVVLAAQPLASLVAQLAVVEWAATHIGIGESAGAKPAPGDVLARRALVGLSTGLAATVLVLGTLWLSRSAMFERMLAIEPSVLGLGFVTAALQAWRDEMLIHGVPLLALRSAGRSPVEMVLACGLTSAGAAFGRGDVSAEAVVVAAELGIVFGTLWTWEWAGPGRAEPSRVAAPAAHAMLLWSIQTLVSGGLVQTRLAADSWAGGDTGILGGKAAVVALAPLCVLGLAGTVRAARDTRS